MNHARLNEIDVLCWRALFLNFVATVEQTNVFIVHTLPTTGTDTSSTTTSTILLYRICIRCSLLEA